MATGSILPVRFDLKSFSLDLRGHAFKLESIPSSMIQCRPHSRMTYEIYPDGMSGIAALIPACLAT
jgi:hypothetical protein